MNSNQFGYTKTHKLRDYADTDCMIGSSESVLVSIIIPTLNCCDKISVALESILVQEERDIEVIISDGGSSDDTIRRTHEILDGTGIPYCIIEKKGSSVYGSLNLGMRVSRGKWVYCLGSDDSLAASDILLEIGKVLRSTRADVVYGVVANGAIGNRIMGGRYTSQALTRMSIPHQATFYRLDFLKTHGLEYNTSYPIEADWDLNLRLWVLTRFQFVDLLVAFYGGRGISCPERNPPSPLKDNLGSVLLSHWGLSAFLSLPSYRLADACQSHSNPVYRIVFALVRFFEALLQVLKRIFAVGFFNRGS